MEIFLLGILIGSGIGSGVTYSLLQRSISQRDKEYIEKARKTVEELEKSHEARMQETIKALQKDYQNQLNRATEDLRKAKESQVEESINVVETQQTNQTQVEPALDSINQVGEEATSDYSLEITEISAEPEAIVTPEEKVESAIAISTTEVQPTSEETIESAIATPTTVVQPASEETIESAIATSKTNVQPTSEEKFESAITASTTEVQPTSEETIESAIATPTTVVQSVEATSPKTPEQRHANRENLQELEKKILAWGNSGEITDINQLNSYIYHPDSHIQSLVASAIGQIVASKGIRAEVNLVVPILGKLIQSSEPFVRQSAVAALSKIQSEKVIPFLKQGLRDSDSDVVKSASLAISKFRNYPVNQKAKSIAVQSKPVKREI